MLDEGYSARAVRTLMLARLAAGCRGATAVGTEDLLVALVAEDQGGPRGAQVKLFGTYSADLRDPYPHKPFLRPRLADHLLGRLRGSRPRSRPVPAPREIPLSRGLRRVLVSAAARKDDLRRRELQPLHLFWALLSREGGRCAKILTSAGISRESVALAEREQPALAAPQGGKGAAGVAMSPSPWSRRARQVLFLARLKAQRRGVAAVEVEDLLLSILIEDQGGLRGAASSVPGVNLDAALVDQPHVPLLGHNLAADLVARLEALCARSEGGLSRSALPMSAPVKRCLRDAELLRSALGQAEVEPAHLLAALVEQGSSTGARMLRDAGITRERVLHLFRRRPQDE